MSILKRFSDIMASNINALLDKAEDPVKMIDQLMRNLNDDLNTNIIDQEEKVQDEYGTYFYNIKTKEVSFLKEEKKLNTYTLKIYFKTTYTSYMYQDIMENIEIIINSQQII